MAMKYTCTVCGNTGKQSGEIYRCQKQGRRKAKHKVGQQIRFVSPASNELRVGVIVEIAFKRKTHEPIYTVKGDFGITNVGHEDIVEQKLAVSA